MKNQAVALYANVILSIICCGVLNFTPAVSSMTILSSSLVSCTNGVPQASNLCEQILLIQQWSVLPEKLNNLDILQVKDIPKRLQLMARG